MSRMRKGVWLHWIDRLGGREGIDRFVNRYADAGFDLLIPCVKQVNGIVEFHSRRAVIRPVFRKWDPLEYMAAAARKAGIGLHAWFCVCPEGAAGNLLKDNPQYTARMPNGRRAKCHSGFFTCLARPQVRDYHYRLMAEVADRYDVDGIHLDYIRTGEDACYCEVCLAAWKKFTGKAFDKDARKKPDTLKWTRWRIGNVTKLVARIARRCHATGKQVSAAVYSSYPATLASQSQDFPGWARAGHVDLVIPMNYTRDPETMMGWTRSHAANLDGAAELWEGLCPAAIRSTAGLIKQVRLVKDHGVKGVCLFEHKYVTDKDLKALAKL